MFYILILLNDWKVLSLFLLLSGIDLLCEVVKVHIFTNFMVETTPPST